MDETEKCYLSNHSFCKIYDTLFYFLIEVERPVNLLFLSLFSVASLSVLISSQLSLVLPAHSAWSFLVFQLGLSGSFSLVFPAQSAWSFKPIQLGLPGPFSLVFHGLSARSSRPGQSVPSAAGPVLPRDNFIFSLWLHLPFAPFPGPFPAVFLSGCKAFSLGNLSLYRAPQTTTNLISHSLARIVFFYLPYSCFMLFI